ncbi:MAG: cobaltochelatase subunit CobN [Gammaproteobacteria bacterium]|nr:cobaltochelatase subunit CobN [Gammaproteobacteria bacterium]
MHLLQAKSGAISDGSEAIDLGQSAGDIVFLSAADTELASLVAARDTFGDDYPRLRLANFMQLSHPLSVDLYVEDILAHAKLIVVRLLGGKAYWSYGVEQAVLAAQQASIPIALLPGDDQPDSELASLSSVSPEAYHRLWQYCVHGGDENARSFLGFAASLIGHARAWQEPRPLVRAGIYWPSVVQPRVEDLAPHWRSDWPVVAIIFYRALVQANNLGPINALIDELTEHGVNPLPIFCSSLKDGVSAELIAQLLAVTQTHLVLNTTGFAVSNPVGAHVPSPFAQANCPVVQVVLAGSPVTQWRDEMHGLSARDIAMNIALPEVDGRIISRAISFKAQAERDENTQCAVVRYAIEPSRVRFVSELAARWSALRNTPPSERRVAIILANYPNRDGRLGNGVGLDTPAGTVNVLRALAQAGYSLAQIPQDGAALIERLQRGPTNAATDGRVIENTIARATYDEWFTTLPSDVQSAVSTRWGDPASDPFYLPDRQAFAVSAFRLGSVVVGLQPARGYNIDPTATYHSPDLVPPHGYFAFYLWLRESIGVHAIVHMGKHGNAEWLPGKAVALSDQCYPELALGPLPHLYPFIVNDPGEGTQAKRRTQAVIVDHLTPPLTRAESYGPLAQLERLVDEYYEASGVDPRRMSVLRTEILALAQDEGLAEDCGIGRTDAPDDALGKLDNFLCELKELQIRDGLHVFGESPQDRLLTDLIVALVRLPRGERPQDASLLRALAKDLALLEDFDPLDCTLGDAWSGSHPDALDNIDAPWRTIGDTVERLETFASALVCGQARPDRQWERVKAVLQEISEQIRPAVEQCGPAEIRGLLDGLNGDFVQPGPSGAPTRGRPDVLPTGRNFFSVDSRVVPTPAAWQLGWHSAALLLERYRQDNGEWPREIALSAWGTSNMRTGGDDIAQALALLGVKPTWEVSSRRVTGFEILPLSVLDRPRVDVTLRVSGFFRDAFPAQIDLFDSAVSAIAAEDEPAALNPIAAKAKADQAWLQDEGVDAPEAWRRATYRVFGSKPGAYGAGLQALIDERGWDDVGDLARAYVSWGGYAYGAGTNGNPEHQLFEHRLRTVQAVVHNQDNREHDLLDSDDYYQFEGGMTAAIRTLSGRAPTVYHNDHSRPESPKIRHLDEEIARVVRARVVNPKWIAGAMRHGYKGAFEMAATVDYLFAFSATTDAVANHHFDAVYAAYIESDDVREFLSEVNPVALKEIATRFLEAEDRGLWQPRSNSARLRLETL